MRASGEFPGKISLQEYNTTDKAIIEEWGVADGLFIDGKEVNTGPAPTYKKLVKKMSKKVKMLQ